MLLILQLVHYKYFLTKSKALESDSVKNRILNSKVILKITGSDFWKKMTKNRLMKKVLTYEFITYVIVGILTTAVNYGIYFLARLIFRDDGGVILSNVIAWIFAVSFAYVTNKIFVFESASWERRVILKEAGAFLGCRLLSLLLDTAFVYVTVAVLHLNEPLFKLFSNIFVLLANYFASKYFIFVKKES